MTPHQELQIEIRDYIKNRGCLNHSALASFIGWNKVSFSRWIRKGQEIDPDTLLILSYVLQKQYGFIPSQQQAHIANPPWVKAVKKFTLIFFALAALAFTSCDVSRSTIDPRAQYQATKCRAYFDYQDSTWVNRCRFESLSVPRSTFVSFLPGTADPGLVFPGEVLSLNHWDSDKELCSGATPQRRISAEGHK